MIKLRRADERSCERRGEQELWLTFDPADRGLEPLQALSEHHLPPSAAVLHHGGGDVEIITYVREGALAYHDSLGRSGVINAGEFQRLTAGGNDVLHDATNASRTEWAHVFQLQFRPSQVQLAPSREQQRFSAAYRRDGLRIIASPDARRGSLSIHQNALVYSALLDAGQHIVHELPADRSAWLHLVSGEVTLADLVLTTGDGVGVTAERAVSFTAGENTEVLLIDVATPAAA